MDTSNLSLDLYNFSDTSYVSEDANNFLSGLLTPESPVSHLVEQLNSQFGQFIGPQDTCYYSVAPSTSPSSLESSSEGFPQDWTFLIDQVSTTTSPSSGVEDQSLQKDSQTKTKQLFPCPQCSKTYTVKRNLDRHYKEKHSTINHTCLICNKKFARKHRLDIHKYQVHYSKSELMEQGIHFKECLNCGKIFFDKAVHRNHVEIHHKHTCHLCNVQFINKHKLVNHLEQFHPDSSK